MWIFCEHELTNPSRIPINFQISVESIDDKEDMQFADEAFDILGFNKEEKYNVYKLTASVMHLGEMKFKKKSAKDDQATADGTKAGEKVATLLGVKVDDLYENFERPKIKVGAEWVTKVKNFETRSLRSFHCPFDVSLFTPKPKWDFV